MRYTIYIILTILVSYTVEAYSQNSIPKNNRFRICYDEELCTKEDGNNFYKRKLVFKDTIISLISHSQYYISGDGTLAGTISRNNDSSSTILVFDSLGNITSKYNHSPDSPIGFWLFNNGYYAIWGQSAFESPFYDPSRFYLYDNTGELVYSNTETWNSQISYNLAIPSNTIAILTALPDHSPKLVRLLIIQHLDDVPIIIHKDIDHWNNYGGIGLGLFPESKKVHIVRRLGSFNNTDTLVFKYNSKRIEEFRK